MIDRSKIFDAVRVMRDGKSFTPDEVKALDAAIDAALGINQGPPPADAPRHVSMAAVDLIHSFEACKLNAYPDPGSRDGNPWTVGWGSTGPDITKGTVWTQAQCDARFLGDLEVFEAGVTKLIGTAPTTQGQFDALVSFSYNLGLGNLRSSTLLKKHKAGDYGGAAGEFGKWINNDGKPMNGLIRRRAAEAAMYRGTPQ